ncbi:MULTISPECIES: ribosomal-processing cysteine protease Prp [Aerococcus]|uniref:Ribosomal processing cysteine protease Prp n=1 Tax=Aerococcus sanguinicola TaxID=119206 RepID=A0A5N1GN46_9LACT|nr:MULTISPECIES: ribosomal-processing cysteine protease Prp [Aerococcus]KAA9301668.1 ribosomal-processing cysteine protease Prp [Aerococcus sanguinicola]MDK6368920.1 ribosomal-processing cysteine protease Prp [Aerococcus sp. UMB9870]MDK6680258.1 ribosomal-processing cysteine protease Prp [Aerococcus sp. UMB8608]MDK6687267.1 ribosomal-processing cysteine protease Prp [Aerococcus sp. UMB8623]MDK6940364.1 ribosomal-processing cysteine protease Prp [Aerococcus sp. UMB8487]
MIKVKFKENQDKHFVSMEISGHALAADPGKDVICAGVSALSIALVNNLERMVGIQSLVESDPEAGYLYVELPQGLTAEQRALADILFKQCQLALKEDIASNYPDYVQYVQG